MKLNIIKKFLNYAEKMEDFIDGECVVNVRNSDEMIIGTMLESYYIQGYQQAIKDYKQELKEKAAKEEFEKQQPSLFNMEDKKNDN